MASEKKRIKAAMKKCVHMSNEERVNFLRKEGLGEVADCIALQGWYVFWFKPSKRKTYWIAKMIYDDRKAFKAFMLKAAEAAKEQGFDDCYQDFLKRIGGDK